MYVTIKMVTKHCCLFVCACVCVCVQVCPWMRKFNIPLNCVHSRIAILGGGRTTHVANLEAEILYSRYDLSHVSAF